MKSSKPFLLAVAATLIGAGIAAAAHVDMNDPRRALGRDGDIRVDAELAQDAVAPNAPLTLTYQIENLSNHPIGIADKITDTDFDPDSLTITLSVGAEIPPGTQMPHLAIIAAGQKRVLTTGALVHLAVPNVQTRWTLVPRYVQVKVTVLKDVSAFAKLIDQQSHAATPVAFPASLFDRWVEASDSILLNTIPVYWQGETPRGTAEASAPAGTD
ncbi:MAG TPA: hypothetical protein VKU62_08440 [Thermoanaerobaculia bacterium]|nr:hypothetical protein [Thermoanaerobaculia bacterium]